MIIELYAVESGVLRTEKLLLKRDIVSCAAPIDITRVYVTDAFESPSTCCETSGECNAGR
jgi:hypothetical protein